MTAVGLKELQKNNGGIKTFFENEINCNTSEEVTYDLLDDNENGWYEYTQAEDEKTTGIRWRTTRKETNEEDNTENESGWLTAELIPIGKNQKDENPIYTFSFATFKPMSEENPA